VAQLSFNVNYPAFEKEIKRIKVMLECLLLSKSQNNLLTHITELG
jgi:hypothetical protein